MEQEELYKQIQEEQIGVASQMILTPYDAIENYQYDKLLEKLAEIPYIDEVDMEVQDGILGGSFFIGDVEYTGGFVYEPFEEGDRYKEYINDMSTYAHLPENGLPKLKEATGNIVFFMDFHEDARFDYLLQLKILYALSSHIALIYDESGYQILPIEQIRYMLSMETFPSYDILYAIHITYDPDGTHWLHTHGLQRCGLIELEILKVNDHIHEYVELLNATAKRYLEEGLPSEEEHINVGYASMVSLEIKWTPWEKALEQETKRHLFQKNADFCGSYKDRQEEHMLPSGVLYAYYEHTFQPINVYDRFLEDNTICYISNEETARMATYAKEALSHFRQLFDEHKTDKENYAFMMKAGMDVQEHDTIQGEKEHLWFEVEEMKEDSFYGELTNDPYGIPSMQCGTSYEVEVSRISDYLILRRDHVNLNPSNIYLYYMEQPMNKNLS